MLHYDHPLPVIFVSCDSHSHLSLVVSIGFNNKLVLSSTSCMSTIMMCHFIIIFNTAGSIEVYQEESQNHMYTNMATIDESELEPSSSKGSHLEPVSAAVKALKDHEDKLVASLKDTDLVSLTRSGLERGFISRDVKKSLESMDPNVHWSTKIRYLFLHVYESLQRNPRFYERWLKLLSEHGASSEALEQVRLSYEGYCARESDYSVSGGANAGDVIGTKRPHKCDYFSEEHVSVLTEILANYGHKWYAIGTLLNLDDDVLHNILATMHKDGIKICLKKVLREWIIGNHEHAKPPTVKSLEETLCSKTVDLDSEANELQENLRKHGVYLTSEVSASKQPRLELTPVEAHDKVTEEKSVLLEVSASKRPCLEVTPIQIVSQTSDCKVIKEKSVLLEVQVTTSHDTTGITYQWMKDGVPLSNDSKTRDAHKQILCINDVTMRSEGTYHCEVQTYENKKLQSEPIKLTLIISPERVKSLKDYEDELVTSLKDADLTNFAKEALETGLIPQTIKNSFDSLDSNVSCSLKIRYLFMYAYERIDNKSSIHYEKWLNLLSRFGVTDALLGQVRQRYEWYTREVSGEESCVSESGEVMVGMKRPHGSNFYFTQKHVSVLTEILADHSHKWQEIGIALNLPLDMLHIYNTNRNRLGHLLWKWIAGGYKYAKPPTVESLEQVLNSKAVSLGSVGSELRETLLLYEVCLINESPMKRPCSQVTPMEIVRRTHDLKVNEEKSTLLEVQLSTSHDTTITYQWMKDRAPLSDDSTYCGTRKQILCINDVTMASEGTYHCEVQTHANKKLQSEPIKLTVIVPPEKRTLIDRYLSQPEIPEDTWPPVSNNTFINLALIKQSEINKAGEYAYNTIQGDIDDILKDKEKIEYNEVFSRLETGARLFIEGRPGSGKTTLVHKVSRDWAKNELQLDSIRLLFLVHLRGFFNDPDIQLTDIMKRYYENESSVSSIISHAESNSGEGLCFILDGLDEYSPPRKNEATIFQLIKRNILPKSVVIVASRPAAVAQLKKVATKRVEVLGFEKEQIFQYIEKYNFSSTEKTGDLHSYLAQHPNVHHMCYLPIHSAMVCFLFDEMGCSLPQTETEMYKNFTNFTLLRSLTRYEENEPCLDSPKDLPAQERKLFLEICKLAFEKTKTSKQVMKHNEVKDFLKDVKSSSKSLGLINVDRISMLSGFQDLYTFLHLTFQEYLAAYHICQLEEEEQTKVIKTYGKKKHMQVVWKFFCGLDINLTKFEELMKSSQSQDDDLFQVQCTFESQQSIICDRVIQSGEEGSLTLKSHFLTPSDMTAIGFIASTASESHPVKKLVLNRCTLGEGGIFAFLNEAGGHVMSIQTLCYHGGNCNMAQLKLVNVLLGQMSALETLDISDTKLGPLKVKALTSKITLPNLESLVVDDINYTVLESLKFISPKLRLIKLPKSLESLLYDTADQFIGTFGISTFFNSIYELGFLHHNHELSNSDVELVSKCLEQYANMHRTRLILTNCNIGDDGAKVFAIGLSIYTGLKELVLNVNNIGDEGSIALAETLTRNPLSHLEKLDISFNAIGDSGAKSLSEGLILCTNLHSLDLRCNKIGDEGAIAITRAVKDVKLLLCNQKITNEGAHTLLDIKHDVDISSMDFSQIDCAGVALSIFCSNTCGSHYNLQLLNFKSRNIGFDGAKALAEGLKHCTNLQTLNLDSNSIGADGAKALAEGLKHCTNLQMLNLDSNSIGADGAKALAEGLKHCTNLQSLDLHSNSIGVDGAKALAEGLKHCTNLQTLDLRSNSIGADGAKALAECLKHCTNLQYNDRESALMYARTVFQSELKPCLNQAI